MTETRNLDRVVFRLGVAALVVAAAVFTLAACRRIWCEDFWWQYATGRLVSTSGVPHQDVLSYTARGAPWIELRWLYCYGLYRLMEATGPVGPILAKWLMLGAAFALVTFSVRNRPRPVIVAGVLLVAVMASLIRFFVRPELVTFLLFGLYVFLIRRHRDTGSRWLFLLPVLQVLWTNAHTLAILGTLLVGLYATTSLIEVVRARGGPEERARTLGRFATVAVVLGLTATASVVNPYGLSGVVFPFLLFSEMSGSAFKEIIGELASPFSMPATLTSVVYYKLLVGLCGLSVLLNWRRLDWFWALLAASQFYLSAVAIRNLPLFALAAVPFILDNVSRSPLLRRPQVSRLRNAAAMTVGVAAIAAGVYHGYELASNRLYVKTGDTNRTGFGLARHWYPERAVAFLRENGMGGKLYHTFKHASYLTAQGIPVFIDPRLEVHGEAHFRHAMRIERGEESWRSAVERHGFEVAFVDLKSVDLLQRILDDEDWTLRYFDETSAVLARRDLFLQAPALVTTRDFTGAVARLREDLPRAEPPGFVRRSSDPYVRVASFLLWRGLPDLALPFLEDARTTYADTFQLERGFAAVRQMRQGTVATYEQALRDDPADTQAMLKLAWACLQAGRRADGHRWLHKAMQQAPGNPEVWAVHASVLIQEGDLTGAREAVAAGLRIAPEDERLRAMERQLQERLR